MTDLTMAELASREVSKLEVQREQNRRDFPQMASYLKLLERFNPRAIWAEENGKRIGRLHEHSGTRRPKGAG